MAMNEGSVLSIVPVRMKVLVWLVIAISSFVLLSLFTAEFNRQVVLIGKVNSSSGRFNVFPHKSGYVSRSWAEEQKQVVKGEPLFEVNSKRFISRGDYYEELRHEIHANIQSLRQEAERANSLNAHEQRSLSVRHALLTEQIAELEQQIVLREQMAESLNSLLTGQRELIKSNYISESLLQEKENEYRFALTELSELKFSLLSLRKEQAATQESLDTLRFTLENTLAALERDISQLQRTLLSAEQENQSVVVAPEGGVITTVRVQAGENVSPDTLSLVIIPDNVSWDVHLYATSEDVGFIRPDNPVKLRYAAFPYQRFGVYTGRVKQVSRAAIVGSSLDSRLPENESFYRVTVSIDDQCIVAYGVCEPLQSGMGVTASVQTGKRTLIEWALDPIYTITGKL